jgi:hypothetical protein
MTEFDFEEWSCLFKADPEAFQERKYALLNDIIAKSAKDIRPKLEHTLFRIRMSEERSKSPLQSAMNSSKLMWECFEKMRTELEVLEQSMDSEAMQKAAQALLMPESTGTPSQKSKLHSVGTKAKKIETKPKVLKSTATKNVTKASATKLTLAKITETTGAKIIRFPSNSR